MKLRFTRRAIQDLSNIADYVYQRNPQAARRVRDSIIESLQTLILFPRVGRQQAVKSVRKLVTRRYPYLVYYSVDEASEEIIVITIQHPARRREHTDA